MQGILRLENVEDAAYNVTLTLKVGATAFGELETSMAVGEGVRGALNGVLRSKYATLTGEWEMEVIFGSRVGVTLAGFKTFVGWVNEDKFNHFRCPVPDIN